MNLNWDENIKENMIAILLLGLVPTLAVTSTFELAYVMGILFFVLFIFSKTVVFLFRKLLSPSLLFPLQVFINGILITIVMLILKDYVPSIPQTFGIYLPLLAINPIHFVPIDSKKEFHLYSFFYACFKMGLSYIFLLSLLGLVRECLGTNTITIVNQLSSFTNETFIYRIFPATEWFPITFFLRPSGAFLLLGLLLACIQKWKGRRVKNGSR